MPRLEIAQQQVQRAESMFARGLTGTVDVAQAKLNLEQVQTDLAKPDLDLALARRQLRSATGASARNGALAD
jgi:outer membrane protein TolC